MADKSIDICPTFYNEDISTLLAGTALITRPSMVWTLIFTVETSGTYVINLSDDNSSYTNAHRIGKIVISGPTTSWNGFGKGLSLTRGLCATCNNAGVDVWGIYE